MKKIILLLLLIVNLAPQIQEGRLSFFSFSSVQAQYYGGAEIGHDIKDPICITPPSHISGSWDNGDGTYSTYSCTTTYSGCDDPGTTECTYYTWGNIAPKDCAGVAYGTAYISDCGCVGGTTGRSENDCIDCNGDINGGAYFAECGCIGGNTGRTFCPPNEEQPPAVCDNPAFNISDASVIKLASPLPLPPGFMGLTMPESIAIEFTVCNDNGVWKPVLTKVFGRYSKTMNMGTVQEVTGIGGNTTSANYCAQVYGLTKVPPNGIQWFMQSALEAHEAVHESRMLPTLTTDNTDLITVIELIEIGLESQDYFITDNGQSVNDVIASVSSLIISTELLTSAYKFWFKLGNEQGKKDHEVTYDAMGNPIPKGAAYLAELPITQPMKKAICEYASQNLLNGWMMCPYCF